MKNKFLIQVSKFRFFGISRMLIFLFALLIAQLSVDAQTSELKKNIKMNDVTVQDLVDKLGADFKYSFFIVDEVIGNTKVSVDLKNATITQILELAFQNKDIAYSISGKSITITAKKKTQIPASSTKKISGLVTDEKGEPIIGASVIVRGSNTGTITNMDGIFVLDVENQSQLIISYIGYLQEQVRIGTSNQYKVVLKEDNKTLEELVVVGYGSARKRDLTGSVTRVDTKKMETMPNVNPMQAMRGTVAGVNVTDNGRPGSDGTITVRGLTSITASNEPLIVLDGIPYTGGRLSDINSNDIESIDILKDASSAAIYGSRATNGVILITTKKGTSSKPLLNYNTYYGTSDFAHTPKLMGPEKYIQLKKDAEAFKGQPVLLQPLEQANFDAGVYIDPWDAIKQNAPIYSHELSISGKNETVAYYVSGSFVDAKSPIAGDNFSRMSLRANFDVKVNDWIKVGTNSGLSFKDYSGNQANLYFASWLSPYADLYYEDGVPRPQPMNIGLVGNPLSSMLLDQNKETTQTLFGNFYADITLPVKGLTYRINTGLTQRADETFNYSPSFIREQYFKLGSGDKRHYKAQSLTVENIVKYNTVVDKIHNFDITGMYSFETLKDESSFLSSNNVFNDVLGWNSLEIGENFSIDTGAGQSNALSLMGRVGYRYGDKYMLNFTIRRDGFSAFGKGRKYGTFPSVGLGWNISEESFLDGATWLDMLKIRASYGKNGNRGIARYASLSKMTLQNYVYGDGGMTSIGLYSTTMANPDLGWESTVASNFGIDFNLFRTRISGSIEYYNMNTEDLLLARRIPNMTGNEIFLSNIGGTQNRGFELTLNTENIKSNGFIWTSSFVFSLNRNKITKLTGVDLNGDGIEDDDIASRWFIGKPLGSNFDYVFDGIWQVGDDMSIDPSAKPGYIRFKDISGPEGVPDGKIGPEDRMVLHSNNPDFIAGLTNTISYKGITLSIMFNTRQGGFRPNTWTNPGTNQYDQANVLDLPYWTPENPISDRPSVGYPNPRGYGFYEDVSFVRLQDLTISYELPKSIISKVKVNNCKVFMSGKNLATWTKWNGWDPEHGGGKGSQFNESNGPLMKSWTVGLNVNL